MAGTGEVGQSRAAISDRKLALNPSADDSHDITPVFYAAFEIISIAVRLASARDTLLSGFEPSLLS